jgi:hypothetical protein
MIRDRAVLPNQSPLPIDAIGRAALCAAASAVRQSLLRKRSVVITSCHDGSLGTVSPETCAGRARCPQRAANRVRKSQLWIVSGVLVSGHGGSLGTASPT